MNAIEATTNELLCQRVTGVQGSERMRIGIANDQIGEQMDGTAHCVHRMLTVGGQCSCCLCYLPNKEHYLLDRAHSSPGGQLQANSVGNVGNTGAS